MTREFQYRAKTKLLALLVSLPLLTSCGKSDKRDEINVAWADFEQLLNRKLKDAGPGADFKEVREDFSQAVIWYLKKSDYDLILGKNYRREVRDIHVFGTVEHLKDVTLNIRDVLFDPKKRVKGNTIASGISVAVVDYDAIESPKWKEYLETRQAVENAKVEEGRRDRYKTAVSSKIWRVNESISDIEKDIEHPDPELSTAFREKMRLRIVENRKTISELEGRLEEMKQLPPALDPKFSAILEEYDGNLGTMEYMVSSTSVRNEEEAMETFMEERQIHALLPKSGSGGLHGYPKWYAINSSGSEVQDLTEQLRETLAETTEQNADL